MKVILTKEVIGTGVPGEVVEVSDGFARNYLFPRNLAAEASTQNLKTNERRKEKYKNQEAAKQAAAEETKAKLEAATIVIKVDVGEEGKLYGSVTTKEIAEEIFAKLGLEIDKRKILLNKTIKEAGDIAVPVKLHKEVEAILKIQVAPKHVRPIEPA
ncbi:MAG: 50S ribosomal protein L9 [Candidatus Margulisiibacteriota bacterium]